MPQSAGYGKMRNLRNYYRLLHVQPDAPVEVIHASYRTMMREMRQHPDLGGLDSYAALLNEAYSTLCDPALRAAYDRKLPVRFERRPHPAHTPRNSEHRCRRCGTSLPDRHGSCLNCPVCGSPLQQGKEAARRSDSRRALTRTKRSDALHYYTRGPQEAQEAEMINLSPKGMRLFCRQRLAPGTVLKISGPDLTASAIVTNSRQEMVNGQNVHSVGISFLEVEFDSPRGLFLSVSA